MSPLRSFVVGAGALALAGCTLGPSLHIGGKASAPPPAAPVCPGGLSADLLPQPAPPATAGLVKAHTQAESDAQAATLTWIHDLAAWGRLGWGRAADAKAYCTAKH